MSTSVYTSIPIDDPSAQTPNADPVLTAEQLRFISADKFIALHDRQIRPPKNGWVHGSRVMCAMRNKGTNEYFPRVTCYVHIEMNNVYLIQTCCSGSFPALFPEQYKDRGYVSWTIGTGEAYAMRNENVAYLGPIEGRNAL